MHDQTKIRVRTRVTTLHVGRTLLLAALCAVFGLGRAQAQLDTPAAREARAALRAVENTYGDRTQWSGWSRLLRLPDVRYELRAGERAEDEALRAAIMELLGGRVPEFAEPSFARLARALDVRAQEIVAIRPAEWPSACRTEAENYQPTTREALEQARAALAEQLDRFEQRMPSVRRADSSWAVFLHWPETRALAAPAEPSPAPDGELLDRLETRWAAAPAVWDNDTLFDSSIAARGYIRLLRSYLKGETRQQHAAAWNELAERLVAIAPHEDPDTTEVAAAVVERERLAQASPLTASIRRQLSRPNLVLQVSKKWLESEFAQEIDEGFDVNEVFAGTRSYGRGQMVGTMRAQILPSSAVGQWVLRIRATSTARTRGSREGVSVASRATTRVSGSKPFELDARGLTPRRASAGAVTSIVYESINAPGRRRRREAAISETRARRPQAERESAAYARRSLLEQINSEAAEMAAEFNRSYYEQVRDPRINANRSAPDIRVRVADDAIQWECLLEGPATFGAPAAPGAFDAGTDVVLCLAASALEEQGTVALGGREMTADDLQESLGSPAGESKRKSRDDFNVTFDADPCDIRFEDGAVHARLFVTKFDSADVKYPAMTVDVAYQPEQRDDGVVFVRQGRVRVTPIVRTDGDRPVISGRQQTLRLAVQRKLAKVLTAELEFSGVTLPLADGEQETTLRLERAQLTAPWLQIALAPESDS